MAVKKHRGDRDGYYRQGNRTRPEIANRHISEDLTALGKRILELLPEASAEDENRRIDSRTFRNGRLIIFIAEGQSPHEQLTVVDVPADNGETVQYEWDAAGTRESQKVRVEGEVFSEYRPQNITNLTGAINAFESEGQSN